MQIRNRILAGMLMMTFGIGPVLSQTTSPATTQPTTRPILTNIEAVMEREVPEFITDNGTTLEKAITQLKTTANANIVVNWNALAAAGLKRNSEITLKLKKVNTEQVIRAICELLSTPTNRLNYVVGEGAVEITTNAHLGNAVITRLIEVEKILPTGKDERSAKEKLLLAVIDAELKRLGEKTDGDRSLEIKGAYLVAKQSKRGLMGAQRVVNAMQAPLKPGSVPPGVVASVRQKKAEAAVLKLLDAEPTDEKKMHRLDELAQGKIEDLNAIRLGSTRDEMARHDKWNLDYLVNEAGIIYVGSAEDIRSRTVFAVYDLRDVVKKLQTLPENNDIGVEELSRRVVSKMKEKVTPQIWTDLGKGPCSLTAYGQLMVVFAPAPVYRAIGASWKDVEK